VLILDMVIGGPKLIPANTSKYKMSANN